MDAIDNRGDDQDSNDDDDGDDHAGDTETALSVGTTWAGVHGVFLPMRRRDSFVL